MDILKKIIVFVFILFLLMSVLFGMILFVQIFLIIGNANIDSFEDDRNTVQLVYLNNSVKLVNFFSSPIVKALNETWLEFDGVNDVVTILSPDTVISFWYRNITTTDWINIVNNSGTTYVDGVLGSPIQYPVFFNGSEYFIGQTGSSSFFNGSMDEVRIYDRLLTVEEIIFLFNLGR